MVEPFAPNYRLVIISIAKVLDKFKKNKYVQAAFYGIRPAVAALIGVIIPF